MKRTLLRADLVPKCRDGQGFPCKKPAPYRLLSPDGEAVPGCFTCHDHADETAREYLLKLGEHWAIVDGRTGDLG